MEGWIKLHRKMLDNPIVMKDADHLAVWVYLLLHATHKEYPAIFRGKKIVLQPGELITGRKSIAEHLMISDSKVTRVLELLESEHQIEQQTGNKNRLISIVNWDFYQETEQQSEQQKVQNIGLLPFVTKNNSDFVSKVNNKWTTETVDAKGFEACHTQESEQQLNNNRTTTEHQVNTNKNERIEEHKNNNYISSEKKNPELYDRSLWENRALEAIRRNDEAALNRCLRTASAFGIHIDIDELKKGR